MDSERDYALMSLTARPVELPITAGLITFLLGVAIDLGMNWLGGKRKKTASSRVESA